MNEQSPEEIARLLREAGPRAEAPDEVGRRVREAVHAHWRRSVAARRRRRAWWVAGAAAAVAAALIFLMSARLLQPSSGPAGALILSVGGVRGAGGDVLMPVSQLAPGATLQTDAGGRAAIRLAGGAIIRMDVGTRIVLKGADALALQSGAVYVDSGGVAGAGGRLTVETQAGVLKDVGTRFEVRLRDGGMTVRVRDGSVRFDGANRFETIPARTELTLDASGRSRTAPLPPNDPAWSWILEVAPSFDLEGRSLGEFLDWVASETGLAVRFAAAAREPEARHIVLHGSVEGIRPDLAADVVLPTCGLNHRLEGDTLVITTPVPATPESNPK